ncbi:hypothetical protein FND50_33180 [Rhodococcus sp. WB9]|uniref:hypothetical protein n=1 Tax=Rhodococcus sp. WB9 TaxID=2594007 RepID=UPI001185AD4C|nr:hypothetical protein [Rhodococcus sp. WB9]QDQ95153.1 hypothetical protein FND50_33180 [Rhodococcus sp. WB9]
MESSVRRLSVDGALLRHLLVRELVMIGLLLITGVTVARAAKNDSSRQVADAVMIAKRPMTRNSCGRGSEWLTGGPPSSRKDWVSPKFGVDRKPRGPMLRQVEISEDDAEILTLTV